MLNFIELFTQLGEKDISLEVKSNTHFTFELIIKGNAFILNANTSFNFLGLHNKIMLANESFATACKLDSRWP